MYKPIIERSFFHNPKPFRDLDAARDAIIAEATEDDDEDVIDYKEKCNANTGKAICLCILVCFVSLGVLSVFSILTDIIICPLIMAHAHKKNRLLYEYYDESDRMNELVEQEKQKETMQKTLAAINTCTSLGASKKMTKNFYKTK